MTYAKVVDMFYAFAKCTDRVSDIFCEALSSI